jgi:hypothetical protein
MSSTAKVPVPLAAFITTGVAVAIADVIEGWGGVGVASCVVEGCSCEMVEIAMWKRAVWMGVLEVGCVKFVGP